MARPYKRVDLSALSYAPIAKDTVARLYVVPLDPPLRVLTTPVELGTDIADPEVPFVFAKPDAGLDAFFEATETKVLEDCLANKASWFAIAKDLEDEVLRRGFKSFKSEKGWKLKVPEDVACFDADKTPINREDLEAGSSVRLALELSRICFGKHEYGATWKVLQVQKVKTAAECLIVDTEPEETPEDDDISSEIDV